MNQTASEVSNNVSSETNINDANTASQPTSTPLTERQAQRLSTLTDIPAQELAGKTVAEIAKRFPYQIDPHLLFFRRICGQVVKTDPATGLDYPVPYATVYVEDTDCSFLGLFPIESPYCWMFPIFCRREDIASVVTDACGHFCVWVPRFEIEYILRFRREFICYEEIFVKPTVGDVLKGLRPQIPPVPGPPVGPGPDPELLKDGGISIRRATELLGPATVSKIVGSEGSAAVGKASRPLAALFDQPAYPHSLPPPLSHALQGLHRREGAKGINKNLGLSGSQAELLQNFNPNRYVGPFWRCQEVFVPELVPILDVPDITFRVTQEIGGSQQTIYSEGFFDVRWNAGPIPDVTLHADSNAIASASCGVPVFECDDFGIQFVGLMPIYTTDPTDASYIDPATGYATRPNRPHQHALITGDTSLSPSFAPFAGTLQLYGCNQMEGAQFYRMLYSYEGAAYVPFVNLAWNVFDNAPPHTAHAVSPDAQGWYPILPNPDDFHPEKLLLDWPTSQFSDGKYQIQLQLGDGSKSPVFTSSAPVTFLVDNSAPTLRFESLAWRRKGDTVWTYFPDLVCPVLIRPKNTDIEFRVAYSVLANHLLDATLSGTGCGAGTPQQVLPSGASLVGWSDPDTPQFDGAGISQNPYAHWYFAEWDNTISRAAIFEVPQYNPVTNDFLDGAYGFTLAASSRAFNPAGGDPADPLSTSVDWYFDAAWVTPTAFLPVAVITG